MSIISFYIMTLVVAAHVFVLGMKRDAFDPDEESSFDKVAQWTAIILFWTAATLYIALSVKLGSSEFIPAMIILALAIAFLNRPK